MNSFDYTRVVHLTHIDLDGFGCAAVTAKVFGGRVTHIQSNYEPELSYRIAEAIAVAKEEAKIGNKTLLLVTDLGLTEPQAAALDEVSKLANLDVMVVDHHKLPWDTSVYPWYTLRIGYAATDTLYALLSSAHIGTSLMCKFVHIVDNYDLFKDRTSEEFALGKLLTEFILEADTRFPREAVPGLYLNYTLGGIKALFEAFAAGKTVAEIDDERNRLVKSVMGKDAAKMTLKDACDLLLAREVAKRPLCMDRDGNKYIATYALKGYSDVAAQVLAERSDVDYFVNLSTTGYLGFRSRTGGTDVQAIAARFGGGGHACAAGGKLNNFKPRISNTTSVLAPVSDLIAALNN